MSEAKHTPGPWEWEFIGTMGNWALLAPNAPPNHSVHVIGQPPPDTPPSPNMRLVAAAPELLEAVKSLLIHPAIQGTHYERHLREVLAKAGEKPCEVSYE